MGAELEAGGAVWAVDHCVKGGRSESKDQAQWCEYTMKPAAKDGRAAAGGVVIREGGETSQAWRQKSLGYAAGGGACRRGEGVGWLFGCWSESEEVATGGLGYGRRRWCAMLIATGSSDGGGEQRRRSDERRKRKTMTASTAAGTDCCCCAEHTRFAKDVRESSELRKRPWPGGALD